MKDVAILSWPHLQVGRQMLEGLFDEEASMAVSGSEVRSPRSIA